MLSPPDAEAIVSLGLSTKGGDSSTVGKFGLGLKSVFYLAEALFFMDARLSPDDRWASPHFDVLSPWLSGDSPIRPEWLQFGTADRARILTHLKELGIPEGFVVWVPLRRKSDCLVPGHELPVQVMSNYFGDQPFSISDQTIQDVQDLMPMLGRVRRIIVKSRPEVDAPLLVLNQVGSQRTSNFRHQAPFQRTFAGAITSTMKAPTVYVGHEVLVEHEWLTSLNQSEHWPSTEVVTLYGNMQKKDPSVPHGAAVWQRSSGQEGRLRALWSVFLPVEEALNEVLNTSSTYTLTLHGYFFLKEDRKAIYDLDPTPDGRLPANVSELRRHWNGLLAVQATLPVVLQGLAEITSDATDDERTEVSRALRRSGFAKQHMEALTSRYQWACVLRNATFQWTLTSAVQTFLPVQRHPALLDLWPELPALAGEHALLDAGSPNFVARTLCAPIWPLDLARQLVAHLDFVALLGRPDQMQGLRMTLRFLPLSELRDVLLQAVRQAWPLCETARLSKHRSEVAALLAELFPEQVLALSESFPAELAERVRLVACRVLIVPFGYAPASKERLLNERDAQLLLDTIQVEDDIAPVLRLIKDRLPETVELAAVCGSRKLLPTSRGSQGTGPWLTLQEAAGLAGTGRIFRQYGDDAALLGHLQDVLGNEQLFLVPNRLVDLLELDIPRLSVTAVLNTVRHAATAAPARDRLALVRKLIESSPTVLERTENRPVLRSLLHGSSAHAADESTPLLISEGSGTLWGKVARLAAESSPLGWTVIRDPVEFLNARAKRFLGVDVASPASLGPLLTGAPHAFPGAKLTPEERETLILEWKDDTLLKKLPLFKTLRGPLTAITPGVHLDGGLAVSDALSGKVILLARPESELLKKRLAALAPVLTPSDVWEYLRNEPDVWQHWQALLDALKKMPGTVTPQRASELPWWPLQAGSGAAPKDVLFFPRMADSHEEIQKLREIGTFTPDRRPVIEADLLPEFRAEAGTTILRLLRSEEQQLEELCALVSQTPLYHVGSITGRARAWMTAFGAMDVRRLPLLGLLHAFEREEIWLTRLLKAASRPLMPERLSEQLLHLYGQITGAADQEVRTAATDAYLALLADVRDAGRPLSVLTNLHLLNGVGEWRKPDDLTVVGAQYDPRYVLHENHRRALYGEGLSSSSDLPVGPAPSMDVPLDIALKNGGQSLRAFVRECEKADIAREQLGAFLGLLDGNPELHKTAAGYLANFDFGVFREQALRDVPSDKLPHGFRTYKELLDQTRLLITVNKGRTQKVANLLGDALEVPFQEDSQLTSIFSHRHGLKPFRHSGFYVYPVELKWVDLQRSDLNLSELLLHSVRWVLSAYHSYLPPHVAAEYFKVVNSSQATVKATQSRLIKAAAQTWGRQLGLSRDSRVRLLLSQIDQADRAAEQAREQGAPAREREALAQVHDHQVRLRKLVEDDADTQKTLLAGVRKKVQDQQYVPASVPFELLQNADDALIEWQEMTREMDERRQTFTLALQGQTLRAVHHGRPVNFYAYGDFDGRSRSFDADLEKMLTLLSSDKGAGVTGQFGLGFKSVFLLSDRPTVKSGRLAFTVLGGVYPVVPTEKEVTALRKFTESVSPPEVADGTLIELPLRDVTQAKNVMARFGDLAPYTLAFTRAIRTLQLHVEGDKSRWTWHAQAIRRGVQLVRAQPSGARHKPLTALVLHTGQVDLLIPLQDGGFGSLPVTIPNLWVTAPTEEALKLPFLVNAAFPLDPGRAQLARNEEQVSAFVRSLVPDLRDALTQLFLSTAEAQWSQVKGWAPPLAPDFLRGLWKVLAESIAQAAPTPALDAVRALLWGTTGAYGALTLEQRLIPSLLPEEYDTLVKAGDPALSILEVESKAAKVLLKQPGFRKKFPPGTLISEQTARTLRALGLPVPQKRINLIDALTLLFPEQQVSPAAALWLTAVLSDEQLRHLREDEATDKWLDGLTFLAQDRAYHLPAHLLVGTSKTESDEAARFPFAPDSARLSEEYPPAALALFRRLRGDAPKLSTVTWLLHATPDKRLAALKYLSALGAKDPVAVDLRQQIAGTWLLHDRMVSSAVWAKLTEEEQIDVLNVLRQARQMLAPPEISTVNVGAEEEDDDVGDLPQLPSDAVRRLAAWWAREGQAYASRYNARLYPGGVPLVTSSDVDLDSAHDRQAWLSLLLLSSLQSMGRVKPEAHRGFLTLLQSKEWIGTYSDPFTSDEAWLGTVRDFLTSNPEVLKFAHWMRGFVGFYQLGRWLPQYVELILNFEHMPTTSLRTLLAPDVNPLLSGSGLSAPPLGRTLGIGGPFLIRELLRAGVLINPALQPLAYVPTRRVCRVVEQLTGITLSEEQPEQNSRAIHAYLMKELGATGATFGGHFDLPLQALAGTGRDDQDARALQQRLFGHTLAGSLA
ncbi:hypothetical protein C8263_07355 [Deinococcus arcticus]|uniref:Uncharacterized protein n=1 Tax=Deinococcus arcticus TaxID=2136176 RepID=A0A2T3W9L8_9DEIO|nr:hypothetical protein C8263_07355 [Deinococcus arcticus]